MRYVRHPVTGKYITESSAKRQGLLPKPAKPPPKPKRVPGGPPGRPPIANRTYEYRVPAAKVPLDPNPDLTLDMFRPKGDSYDWLRLETTDRIIRQRVFGRDFSLPVVRSPAKVEEARRAIAASRVHRHFSRESGPASTFLYDDGEVEWVPEGKSPSRQRWVKQFASGHDYTVDEHTAAQLVKGGQPVEGFTEDDAQRLDNRLAKRRQREREASPPEPNPDDEFEVITSSYDGRVLRYVNKTTGESRRHL